MDIWRARRTRVACLLLAWLIGLPAAATLEEKEVWITIERGALGAFEAAERGQPAPGVSPAGAASREVVAAALSEARIGDLSAFMHARYRVCGGFIAHPSREDALAEVARAAAEAAGEAPVEGAAPRVDYTIDNGAVARALIADVQEANLRNTIASLEGFFTRRHNCPSGYDSALWIKALWEGYAQGRPDVTVELFNHPPTTTPQPSVILTIPGLPGETGVVVLGAHQDSIAGSSCTTNRAPGADDDASGVAVLSEVARAALSLGYRPQQTVRFMAYAAEEVGLRGSADIAATYQSQGIDVVGVLQFDMTNWRGSPADIYFITDYTSAAQNAFLQQLVDVYVPSAGVAGSSRGTTVCGYACSDHASWNGRGYPASFPFEATFSQHDPYIHTSADTLANMGGNARPTLAFARLAAAYVAELAKGSLSPVTAGNAPSR